MTRPRTTDTLIVDYTKFARKTTQDKTFNTEVLLYYVWLLITEWCSVSGLMPDNTQNTVTRNPSENSPMPYRNKKNANRGQNLKYTGQAYTKMLSECYMLKI